MGNEKSWNELCGIVRSAKYGFSYHDAESLITDAYRAGEENENLTKEGHLSYLILEHMITEVFEVGNIIVKRIGNEHKNYEFKSYTDENGEVKYKHIVKPGFRAKYYMYRKEPVEPIDYFAIHYDTSVPIDEYMYCSRDEIIEEAQKHSDIIENRYESVEVEFPTGEIHISNFFCENRDDGFDIIPKDIRYKREYSINHAVGRQNVAEWLSENRNLAYGQLGNTSCSVYKVNDDKLVVTSSFACTEVEDEDGWYGEEDLPLPEDWIFIGGVCCDVWRIELVDQQGLTDYGFNLDSYKKENEHKEFSSVQVNPGKWKMKNYYRQRSEEEIMDEFGYPIWMELERIKD